MPAAVAGRWIGSRLPNADASGSGAAIEAPVVVSVGIA